MNDLLLIAPRHIIGVVVLLLIVGFVVLSKKKGNGSKVVVVKQPLWKMTSRLQGALIAPTRSIYSTHIQTGNVGFVEYDGVPYKVFGKRVVDDPRALCYGGNSALGTDITILDHEPVEGVEPVRLLEREPIVGEPIMCYFHNRTVKFKVGFVGETVVYNAGAIGGDSSSPVATEGGELVTLNSMNWGYGPNLFRIRDILFDGLGSDVEPSGK